MPLYGNLGYEQYFPQNGQSVQFPAHAPMGVMPSGGPFPEVLVLILFLLCTTSRLLIELPWATRVPSNCRTSRATGSSSLQARAYHCPLLCRQCQDKCQPRKQAPGASAYLVLSQL